jgi:hypothetical protein
LIELQIQIKTGVLLLDMHGIDLLSQYWQMENSALQLNGAFFVSYTCIRSCYVFVQEKQSMTALTNKFQEITRQLQQLTIWKQSEHDPFVELDRWHTETHATIEQIYKKKRQQIEQLTEKHEQEFIRQLTRQRSSLNGIRKKLSPKKEINAHTRAYIETSIVNDLNRIENDINIRLGRAEIIVETIPLNFEDSVTVGLKTYLPSTSPMCFKEILTTNQSQKPIRRSANEAHRAFDRWLQVKINEEGNVRKELHSARQNGQHTQEEQLIKQKQKDDAYHNWLHMKKTEGAVIKKKFDINDNDIQQETDETLKTFS